jgi:predicted hydrolase (HD superfamily)
MNEEKKIIPDAEAVIEAEDATAEDLRKEGLSDDMLDSVAGGAGKKNLTVSKKKKLYCPMCKYDHVIAVIKEPALVNGNRYTQYYCYASKTYFIRATNGYFATDGEQIH